MVVDGTVIVEVAMVVETTVVVVDASVDNVVGCSVEGCAVVEAFVVVVGAVDVVVKTSEGNSIKVCYTKLAFAVISLGNQS